MSKAILSFFFLGLVSCAGTPAPEEHHFEQPWLNDPRLKEWQRLADLKEAVRRKGGMQPQMQETEGVGTVFVWSHALEGGPGWEFLRATYSYQNTAGTSFDTIKVWIEVLSPEGEVVNREEQYLMHPLGYALAPGDTWSDVLRVATKGVHERGGWSFRTGCEPVTMKVLPAQRPGH